MTAKLDDDISFYHAAMTFLAATIEWIPFATAEKWDLNNTYNHFYYARRQKTKKMQEKK